MQPTRQLVILSYFILLLVAFEALVVYNVKSWVSVKQWFAGMKRARRERAALLEARQRRDRERQALLSSFAASAGGSAASPRGGKAGSNVSSPSGVGAAVPASAFAPAQASSSTFKDPGATAAAVDDDGNDEPPSSQTGAGAAGAEAAGDGSGLASPRRSVAQYLTLSRSFVPPKGTPWTWRGGDGGGGGMRGGGGGAGNYAGAATTPATAAARSSSAAAADPHHHLERADALSASTRLRRRREAVERQLDDDVRASWYSWVAWKIDMSSAVALSLVYVLVTVLIFVIGVARAPRECELSGQDNALCEGANASLRSHAKEGRI